MALAKKLQNAGGNVYVLMGDGEMQEGVIWEAVMAANKFQADNLIAIGDINGVQLDGATEQIMPMLDIGLKFNAFGWNVLWCDGHDAASIAEGIGQLKAAVGKPSILLCRTVKGKGVSFMEGQSSWHGRPIGDAEYHAAMLELEGRCHV
jgi:transketolase